MSTLVASHYDAYPRARSFSQVMRAMQPPRRLRPTVERRGPIYTLPPELLSCIFEFVVWSPELPKDGVSALLRLTGVSKDWYLAATRLEFARLQINLEKAWSGPVLPRVRSVLERGLRRVLPQELRLDSTYAIRPRYAISDVVKVVPTRLVKTLFVHTDLMVSNTPGEFTFPSVEECTISCYYPSTVRDTLRAIDLARLRRLDVSLTSDSDDYLTSIPVDDGDQWQVPKLRSMRLPVTEQTIAACEVLIRESVTPQIDTITLDIKRDGLFEPIVTALLSRTDRDKKLSLNIQSLRSADAATEHPGIPRLKNYAKELGWTCSITFVVKEAPQPTP